MFFVFGIFNDLYVVYVLNQYQYCTVNGTRVLYCRQRTQYQYLWYQVLYVQYRYRSLL